jgi:hypothetical protein
LLDYQGIKNHPRFINNMNKIGQGYYYNVYDLGNGRVLKKRTDHRTRLKKLFAWYGKTPLAKMRIFLAYPRDLWDARRELKRSVKTSTLDPEIFGNPVFKKRFEYEQDKTVLLGEYFENHTLAENKVRFNEYPHLLHILWTCGLSDTVFNFTKNNGVSARTHKLIFVDFNEFEKSKEKVAGCIKNHKWQTQASLRDMPESELKDYILSKMMEEITLQNLDRFWNRQTKFDLSTISTSTAARTAPVP